MKHHLTSLLLAALLLGACGDKQKDPKAADDTTLATVGEHKITKQHFEAFLESKRIPASDEAAKNRAFDEFLRREAMAEAIRRQKLLDPARIAADVREYEKELLIGGYFQKFLDDRVDDEAIQNFYNAHAADYEETKVHAAHILLRLNPKMDESERKAKLTQLQEVHSKLTSGGDFAKLAEEFSEDRVTGKRGGDLGWLREGSIDPRFSTKVFAMKQDELSEPFETTFGYHIVKIIEAPQTIKRPLQAVKGDIRHQLRAQIKEGELSRLLGHIEVKRSDGKPGPKEAKQAKEAATAKAKTPAAPTSANAGTMAAKTQGGSP
ncbi:MAG: peptidylprolyl isomerase [Myxococcales bacterium]|nr:peptidylprolyl isomerase [Myxococcales bacterium]